MIRQRLAALDGRLQRLRLDRLQLDQITLSLLQSAEKNPQMLRPVLLSARRAWK
jgi:hypothetical protein